MALHRKVDDSGERDVDINPIYVQEAGHEVPKHALPRGGMLPGTALQVVRDLSLIHISEPTRPY